MDVGLLRRVVRPRVDVNHLGPLFQRRAEVRLEDDGVLFGGVRATDEEHVRLSEVVQGVRHRARAEPGAHRRDRRGVTESSAVVDVVRPEDAGEFLENVVLLVRAVRRGEEAQRVRPVRLDDVCEPLDDPVDGLVPRRGDEVAVFADERPGETLVVLDHLERRDALRTDLPPAVHRPRHARRLPRRAGVLNRTADATERTDALCWLEPAVPGRRGVGAAVGHCLWVAGRRLRLVGRRVTHTHAFGAGDKDVHPRYAGSWGQLWQDRARRRRRPRNERLLPWTP